MKMVCLLLQAVSIAAVANRLAVSSHATSWHATACTPRLSRVVVAAWKGGRPPRVYSTGQKVLDKLSSLRSTKSAPVDFEGMGRVLRGSGKLDGAALKEVPTACQLHTSASLTASLMASLTASLIAILPTTLPYMPTIIPHSCLSSREWAHRAGELSLFTCMECAPPPPLAHSLTHP